MSLVPKVIFTQFSSLMIFSTHLFCLATSNGAFFYETFLVIVNHCVGVVKDWCLDVAKTSHFLPFRPSAEGRRPMSYEEDLQLPESGSLVQCISVDPHSAVFGRNGLRLDHQQEQQQVLTPPDVTGDYLKYGRSSTSFLSSFQSPSHKDEANATTSTPMAVAAVAASFWANGKRGKETFSLLYCCMVL